MTAIRKRVLLAIWIPTLLAMAAAGGAFVSTDAHAGPDELYPYYQTEAPATDWWGDLVLQGSSPEFSCMDTRTVPCSPIPEIPMPDLPDPEPIDGGGQAEPEVDTDVGDVPLPIPPAPGGN